MSYYVARVQLTDEVDTPKGPKIKKISETYLVEAMSVTEAEAKLVNKFTKDAVQLEYEVVKVSETKVIEVF